MTLITRQGKGSKLTIQEMDGNLEYLDEASFPFTGSAEISGSLTVALPIPGKDNFTFDISTGKNVYTDLPFVGVNFTGSGLVILGEEDSNMGKASMLNSSNTILTIPTIGGAAFSQSVAAFTLNTGSIESIMGISHQDQTSIGGDKSLLVQLQIAPDGIFAGNRKAIVEVNSEFIPQLKFDDASGQEAIARVNIDEGVAGMTVYTDIPLSTTSSFRIITDSNQTIFDVKTNGMVILSQLSSSFSASDDADAATKGIPIGGLYHTNGTVKIRLS